MILKSQGILKRFGVWVIRLINRIRSHLYTYIIFASMTAGIFSIATWLVLYEASERLFLINYVKHAETIAYDIKELVENKNLTYHQAIETIDFSQYYGENVRIESNNEDNDSEHHKKDLDSPDDVLYMFPINYSDGSGEVLIRPMMRMLVPNYFQFIIAIISVFVFISIVFFFLKKSIRYIEEIDMSIDIIAGGKLTYKIPVRGNDELSRLAVNINEMSNSLKEKMDAEKESDIKQRQLITNISHDLRTPLTVLIGYLDLLGKHSYENQEEADDFIYCALEKCKQLQKLIEELFTYNKLINGDVPIYLEKLDIVEFIQKNISKQGIKINLEAKEKDAIILIDGKLMNRLLDNLFDNIRKYGINNECATIYIKKADYKVTLIVENSTTQDLSDKVDKLFERMYVGNESRTDNSSGLGLSIVAKIADLMNGRIYAEFQKPIFQIIIEFDEVIS